MKNKNIAYLIILIVLIAIILIAWALLKVVPGGSTNTSYTPGTSTTTPGSGTNQALNTYSNSKYGFSIQYPTTLSLISPESAGDLDGLDTTNIFTAEEPKDKFAGTNLYDVKIIAGAKVTPDAESCNGRIYGNNYSDLNQDVPPLIVNIGGIIFNKINLKDAGAGNFYDTTRYSTYRGKTCYEMIVVAHSANIDLIHDVNPNAVQYNNSLFLPDFQQIVNSFKIT